MIERIIKAECWMVDLSPKVTRSDAIQSFESQQTPIVRLTSENGHTGVGYSYTIGTGGHSIIDLLRHTLLPAIIGADASRIEACWQSLLYRTHATSVGAITSLALATIDTALWDIRCKTTQLPLWKILGGYKSKVPLYSTEGGWLHLSVDELVEDAVTMKTAGFIGSKIKIGRSKLSDDRDRLRAVREAVGDDYLIMVDANQSFSLAEALRRIPMLEANNIHWFEEPLPADDVTGHVELSRHSAVPIAVGESLYSPSQFKDYISLGACSVIQADVARVGGITPWLKIAHLAQAYNVDICPHFLMELHLSLVCAVPNAPVLEYIPQLDAITNHQLHIDKGYARAPASRNIGIDWNHEEITSRCVNDTHFIVESED